MSLQYKNANSEEVVCKECLLLSRTLSHFIFVGAVYVVLLKVAMATFVPGNKVSDTKALLMAELSKNSEGSNNRHVLLFSPIAVKRIPSDTYTLV